MALRAVVAQAVEAATARRVSTRLETVDEAAAAVSACNSRRRHSTHRSTSLLLGSAGAAAAVVLAAEAATGLTGVAAIPRAPAGQVAKADEVLHSSPLLQ